MWTRKGKLSDYTQRNSKPGTTRHVDCKRIGEASEAEFLARAARIFFRLAKPWGESDSYDVIVAIGRGFWRVQVKCATSYFRGQYVVKAGGDSHNYTKDDIDFLAAHIVPENIWYIVPIEAFKGKTMLHFCPHKTGKAKYERYREAWCLLKCPPRRRGLNDVPTHCRCGGALPTVCAVCPRRELPGQGPML